MANFVEGGSEAFVALSEAEKHVNSVDFLNQQMYNMPAMVQETGNSFFAAAREMYEQVNSSRAMAVATAAKRAVSGLWQGNYIHRLDDIGQMQWANPNMQRWIMANPSIRQRYLDQTIEGYSGTYIGPEDPNIIGESHYDYRRVMNGIVEESEEHGWTATTYFEELQYGDRELHLEEQVDILDTWENILQRIRKGGEDPTSRWNSKL